MPLLLVHGMLASRSQWLRNLPALREVSRPVVVELLGHGRSPSPRESEPYFPEAYVRQFEDLRRRLGVERWFICGQSLGAALTLRYALDHPERVIAQVFTNSNSALAEEGFGERIRKGMEAQARAMEESGAEALERIPVHPRHSRRLPEDVKRALVEDARLHDPVGVARTGLYTVPDSSVRGRLSQLRVPTLLVCGENETRFAQHRRFAQDSIPGLEVVDLEAGHAVNAEAAEGFNQAVAAFLSKRAPSKSG